MKKDPVAWGVLKKVKDGRKVTYLIKVGCPFCGEIHTHGAGKDGKALGYRTSHCSNGDYEVRAIVREAVK